MNADDGIEDIRLIRGLEGEKFARGVLRSSPKPEKNIYFLPSERDRDFLSPVFDTAAPKRVFIRRLAGTRHVSPAFFVNTVTRGWVGAPNERAPFRFHGAVVDFVDRCLSRTRDLVASN